LGERGAEDAVAREERPLREVLRVAAELADPEVRAVVVLPEQERGVEAERLAHEAQREQHGLVDLLHAGAREALLVPLPRARPGGRAEQAIAPGVLAKTCDLRVEPRAG